MISYLRFVELGESGKALTKQVSRIDRENIAPTISEVMSVLSKFGVKRSDITPLGSTGKKDSSGDIDLGVKSDPVVAYFKTPDLPSALKLLRVHLQEAFGECKYFFGTQLTIPVQIKNQDRFQNNLFVQVDLMFTPSLKAASFYYHSPSQGESDYSGMYRTMLLMSIAINANRVDKDNNQVLRYWVDKHRGLIRGLETTDGLKRIASDQQTISDDPTKIVHTLLGPGFDSSYANSYESLLRAIKSPNFIWRKSTPDIITTFKSILTKQHIQIPPGI